VGKAAMVAASTTISKTDTTTTLMRLKGYPLLSLCGGRSGQPPPSCRTIVVEIT
jgi:hypothetical protein